MTNDELAMETVVRGLLPFIHHFIVSEWDWRPWMTEPPRVPLVDGGPFVHSPGHYKDTAAWIITFEGAYPWAIDFAWKSVAEGPLKDYVDKHGLFIDTEAGWAISVTPKSSD